jgi:hypothetical protein
VSKFTRVHSQVQDLRRSGASTSDILQEALELYKVKHPKRHSFSYLHCWYLLHDVPRWAEGSFTEYRRPTIVVGSAGIQLQMAPASDLESNCVEVDVEIT